MKPIFIKMVLINLMVFLVLIFIVEGILLASGHRPYSSIDKSQIRLVSGGHFFQKDSLLGYTQQAGIFNIALKEGIYRFETQHDTNTLRNTSPSDTISKEKKEIWLFGCSLTYGWSLNDEDTFPWLLQTKMPDYHVVNWGVNGYGTIQFYLQLEKALQNGSKPAIVVVNHADFHHERNINSYNYLRSFSNWNDFENVRRPYVSKITDDHLELQYIENNYQPWFLSTKYICVFYVQLFWERVLDGLNHKKSWRITAHLLDKMEQLCQTYNIRFVIANVGLKKEFISSYSENKQIDYVDISVDFTQKQFNNLPYDKHPNAAAHQKFAERLYAFLKMKNNRAEIIEQR